MKKVLFIDDQIDEWIGILKDYLRPYGFTIVGEAEPDKALYMIKKHNPDVIMLDLMFGGKNLGKGALKQIKDKYPNKPVMIITTTLDKAEFVEKDYVLAEDSYFKDMLNDKDDFHDLASKLNNIIQNSEFKECSNSVISLDEEFGFIVGTSADMVTACDIMKKAAASDVTVLITGESGTGKEMIARTIHTKSNRSQYPFITINCAAIPLNLLESELFGHEKGAFTGADRRKEGKFQQANGGSIFLDEIGDLPLALQVKILRALQEREIDRLGGTAPIFINARIIAATNKNLQEEVLSRNFREDLFYRLNTVNIHLPPLRERSSDFDALYKYFVAKHSETLKKRIALKLRDDVLDKFRAYHWPGNIREFGHAIERAILLTRHPVLQPVDFMNLGENNPNSGIFESVQKIVQSIWDGKLTWDHVQKEFSKKSERRTAILRGLIEVWISVKERRPSNKELADLLKTNPGNMRQKLSECGLRLTDWDHSDR